ncbi:hypothetical protein CHH28_12335 [Bacterioplanes sanyensis]|uniref:Porin domain-containing protein n=1 Tax=Bacterioplanes sanyensis TaxID=1249553 RepID=A0A222FMG3_9GAMM|nr:porin [Bacterioplanes sanyensis]ASP39413.1 hypothetical protein CHH28_12335 [Bacterioplanes sanyensis]
MFKKSSLALAVAGFAFAGSAMAAPSVDLYGRIDLGVEYYSDEDGVGSDLFEGMQATVGNSDDRDFSMTNGNNSRLGVKGSEKLDSGLTLAYQYEMRIDSLTNGKAPGTRHAWLSIAKGPHMLKVGAQDNYLTQYGGFNAQISEVHGFGAYYYTTCAMPGSMSCTFRTNSTISYTFGGGAFSGDTFTATVAAHIAEDNRKFGPEGDEQTANVAGITGMTAGAEVNLGALAITGAYQTSMVSEAEDFEGDLTAPSVMSLGARYAVMDGFNLGFNYQLLDRDLDENSERNSWVVGGDYQLTENVHFHAGFGAGSDDDDNAQQLDSNLFAQIIYSTSDSSHVRLELEQVTYSSDTDALEGDAMIALVSFRQGF